MRESRRIARLGSFVIPALLCLTVEAQTIVPRIDWGSHPGSFPSRNAQGKTGWLIVPERRFPALNDRTIRLPFIILNGRSDSLRPDPVLDEFLAKLGYFLERKKQKRTIAHCEREPDKTILLISSAEH
jgi:hypothetical protein